MELFKAVLICVSMLGLYVFLITSGVVSYARISSVVGAMLIVSDSFSLVCLSFWNYLVINSFCPWLMIFKGRPATTIIAEGCQHAYNFMNVWAGNNLDSLINFGACLIELIGGPALGIALTAVWIIITYKSFAVIFSKLFNRK